MSAGAIDNCPNCGKLFVKSPYHDVCPACQKEIEQKYEICHEYLRENKRCTIQEMSDATGVSIKQITRFIREGRLSLVNAPNMGYPCEMCGVLIRESHICDNCRRKLTKDLRQLNEDAERKAELQKREEHMRYNISDRLRERR